MFYNDGKKFLTTCFQHFGFFEYSDLHSNFKSFFEILYINDFLDDFSIGSLVNFLLDVLMSLYILTIQHTYQNLLYQD